MHMPPTLTRRMQVLLDDERYERLASRAETTGSLFGVDDVASGDSGGAVFSIPPYSYTPSGATIRTVTPAVG